MSVVTTEAIILHSFDYLESSKIIRLLTREAGLISVIAKGAKRTRGKYGSALDLFAQGEAQIYLKQGRDLQTMASLEVSNTHEAISYDIGRIYAASAISELILRMARDEPGDELFDAVSSAFASLAATDPNRVTSVALGAAWRIVSEAGFTPALDNCAHCHATLDRSQQFYFAPTPGGAVCQNCVALSPSYRKLPASARDSIRSWLSGQEVELGQAEGKAHQRLLREFIVEHLSEGRPLKAYLAWESADI